MIAEAFLKKRQQKGREDGIEIGKREKDAEWRAWHERWQQAKSRDGFCCINLRGS